MGGVRQNAGLRDAGPIEDMSTAPGKCISTMRHSIISTATYVWRRRDGVERGHRDRQADTHKNEDSRRGGETADARNFRKFLTGML